MAGVEWQSLRDEFTSAAALAVDQSHILSGKSKWGDYLHCYWRHFHPLFPILHYATTVPAPPPALALLMVIIGAQFSTLPESKIHSITMHDSCIKLFSTVSFSTKIRMNSELTRASAKPSHSMLLPFGYADDTFAGSLSPVSGTGSEARKYSHVLPVSGSVLQRKRWAL